MKSPDERPHSAQSDRALARILRAAGGQAMLDQLADNLPGSDLTTLLLEAFRRRARRLTPADVMRRYGTDRFAAPGSVSFASLRRAEDLMLAVLPDGFDVVTLAPVVPLGTHWVTGGVDPRKVVATIRGSEVAADPTNGLALEAAARRRRLLGRSPRSAEPIRLAATQRVTRGQFVTGPVSFAHFQLLGLVTAGRDTGGQEFERRHLTEHLRFAARGLMECGANYVRVALTCLDDTASWALPTAREGLADLAGVEVTNAPERQSGRAYYRGLCFKVFAGTADGEPLEIGDGGFVDWTARLLGNRKERLLTSGYGLDRLAIMTGGSPPAAVR
jgi:hypothetical protein